MKCKWILWSSMLIVCVFFIVTATKVMASGVGDELSAILEAGTSGFRVYLDWLLEVLKVVW